MRGSNLKIYAIGLSIIFLFSCFIVSADDSTSILTSDNDDFYFVQLTDTHVRHKIFFDRQETSANRLTTVLDEIKSFENPPAFITITGDLCEWAAGFTGALNCIAFLDCFHIKDDQLYADEELTIPVYTTPGNHDYVLQRNLNNYHRYIDKNHVADEDRYVVTYGDVSLFFMDSGPNYYSNLFILFEWHGEGLYDCDIEWLEEELSLCESTYKIVLMHHPAVGEERDLFIYNREGFVNICENYDVELVLTGHTHNSRVYDSEGIAYTELPLNCDDYSTLYVQTDDCREGIHYRNISFLDDSIILEGTEELEYTSHINSIYNNAYLMRYIKTWKNIYK